MDAVLIEQSSEQPESILVPRDAAKAFGRGLRQQLSPFLQQIKLSVSNLPTGKNVDSINAGFTRITNLLNSLEKAKESKVITFTSDAGLESSEFQFSQESEEGDLKPGELIIGSDIARKFMLAINHHLINPLAIIIGQTENISSQETKAKIVDACTQIQESLRPLTNVQEIRMTTDTMGNTTIIPIGTTSKDITSS